MNIIVNAVFPTLVLLVLGNVFRRRSFLVAEFWGAADKLTYFVLFPALLITKVSQVDLSIVNFPLILVFIALYFSLISMIAFIIYRFTGTASNQFSSIYQGCLRFNTYILFAVVEAVWGQSTLSLAALFAGAVIPFTNICCVASFSMATGQFSLWATLRAIGQNPLILAALCGFIMNVFPVLLPPVLLNSLTILGKAALPLALLSVGAALQIRMLWKKHDSFTRTSLYLVTFSSLVLAPALTYLLASLLNIGMELRNVLVIYAGVPTAMSSFILAKHLGGDAPMMAAIISLQTVLSMLTLTCWLLILA